MKNQNQKGFIPVLIALVVVAAVAVGGYFVLQKSGIAPSISIPGVSSLALNANCKFNDPDLCKYINRMMTDYANLMKNYEMNSVTNSPDNKKSESFFKIDMGKTQMQTVMDGKEFMNFITIGDYDYTKDQTDGKWWKQKREKMKQ